MIDSPPANAVTDASVIAHRTTGVVFVIGSEQVNRNTVRNTIEQLLASKATILGAVLNRVNIRKNPYYYANYYKHDYAGYYSAEKIGYRDSLTTRKVLQQQTTAPFSARDRSAR